MHPNIEISPARRLRFPLFRSILPLRPGMVAPLALTSLLCSARAGEVGAYPYVVSWPDGTNNFGTYTTAPSGSVSPSAAGVGWNSYASGGFHGLVADGSASSAGTGSFGKPEVGGAAYWFEQITISSPSVPDGTIGTADFTLFFGGQVSAGPSHPTQSGSYRASIGYRWAAHVDGADGVADPNVGESYSETVTVFSSYSETTGGNFRNQPRNHQVTFRFGQPFDFTVGVNSRGSVWKNSPSKVRAQVHCTGWNGFNNVGIRFGNPVTDATITSQSGFNYANPGSASYAGWARLFQLDASSMQADSNGNRLPNLLEYALGRDPLEPDSSPPVTQGVANVGGIDYATFTFTRPRLGARAGDVVYLPQRADNLSAWTTAGVETTVAPSTTDTETVTVRSTQPKGSQTSEFLRLEVTGP